MSSTFEGICQICQQQGHSALDCPRLEAAALARAVSKSGAGPPGGASASASAQLINYGNITIEQYGNARRHQTHHGALSSILPAGGSSDTFLGDALKSVPVGVKKHHHHHHHDNDEQTGEGSHKRARIGDKIVEEDNPQVNDTGAYVGNEPTAATKEEQFSAALGGAEQEGSSSDQHAVGQ
jgi:hypothetical protein